MNSFAEYRFSILLVAMVVLNITRTASVGVIDHPLFLNLIGMGVLVFAISALSFEPRSRAISLILGVPAIGLTLFRNFFTGNTELLVSNLGRIIGIVFLVFTIAVILRTLITQPTVTRDSIAGAFCGYTLIGVAFAEAYCLLETLAPGSFQVGNLKSDWTHDPVSRWYMLEYFSFTTMTTLGFGDVLPASPIARCLTVWEAICGQFYLAVLVAGLVNLRGSRMVSSLDSGSERLKTR
ncbi:ion channel [Schlesneria paludicola]|uniref:ion channel n=1 Tax=Schlesneria paludicola TaxID=360056 RepID=UPI00029A4C02|nr:ion channel [Schlesneria paludicola]